MRKIILLLIVVLISTEMYGQRVVHDRRALAAMNTAMTVRTGSYVAINAQMQEMVELAQSMNIHLGQVYFVQQTLYNSLQNVNAFRGDARNVQTAVSTFSDIINLLDDIRVLAQRSGNPALLAVARDTQREMTHRATELFHNVGGVVWTGNSSNLLDPAQRLELLRHINMELRVMRGLVFSILRQMQTAERNGVFLTLMGHRPAVNRAAIVNEIMRDLRFVIN
jgi:hypothetical protein